MIPASFSDLMPVVLNASTTAVFVLLRLLVIFVLAWIAIRFVRIGLRHLERVVIKAAEASDASPDTAKKRAATLSAILRTIALAFIWAVIIVETLAQVGVDIRPVLAGAGIIGLAVGFGAQNLIRDLISGFFIILEDQIRIGDVAIINGTGGLVEAITFRTITLRDFSQVVHIFPNGAINTLSNMTKGWSAFVLDMGVAYKEDTDRVAEVMKRVGEELRQDPLFGEKILEPLELIGVDNFADSAVVIRVRIKTKPIEQWNVGREYRRRLKKAFDAEGIEIPFPHRSLYVGEACGPLKVEVLGSLAEAPR
jgi:small-conductance mechanosensitive channel